MKNIPFSKIGYRIIQCQKKNCGVEVKTNSGRTKYCQKHGFWKPELKQKRQAVFAQEFPQQSHHTPSSDLERYESRLLLKRDCIMCHKPITDIRRRKICSELCALQYNKERSHRTGGAEFLAQKYASTIPITQEMTPSLRTPTSDLSFSVPLLIIAGALLWQLYILFLTS